MKQLLNIVLLEDSKEDAELIEAAITAANIDFKLYCTDDKLSFLNLLHQSQPDLVLSDYKVPSFSGFEVLELTRELYPHIPFIFVSGTIGEEIAIESMKAGATDYVLKNKLIRLGPAIRRAMEEAELRNEKKLIEEDRNRLVSLVDSSHASVTVHDLEGHFLYANQVTLDMHGYTRKEFMALNLHQLDVPESEELIVERIKEIMEHGKANFEVCHYRKDGSIIPLDISVRKTNWDNKIVLESIAIDITEHKRTEALIKENEEFLNSVIENIPNMIFVKETKEMRFVRFNKAGEELLGFKKEDLYGKNGYDFFPKEQADWFEDDDRKVLASKNLKDIPEEFIDTKYKGQRILHTKKIPIMDDRGNPKFLLGISEDITVRKETEEKLREKDIQFKKLSSNLPDLIFQFTRKADGSYCVPIASEGIKNIFGCSPEDVIDDFAPISRVIYPDDAERVISDIEFSAKHLTYFTCEFRVQIPGKEIQWIFSRSTPEKLADGSITWYGFNVDITSQKLAEKEIIKQKERAEESDRLKSAFLANLSHEIRTPLNGILGFSGFLKEKNIDEETRFEYVDIISSCGHNLLGIINEIVDISLLEAGLVKVEEKGLYLNKLMKDVCRFYKEKIEQESKTNKSKVTKEKEINIQLTKLSKHGDIFAYIDEVKLRQIVSNLVNNSLKFTEKGEITIGFGINKDKALEFSVKDTGIGIAKEKFNIIFERFRQVEETSSRTYGGMGLGLSIAKKMVEIMGGNIWIESEVGIGTTISFTLPFKPYQPEISKIQQDARANKLMWKNKTILIAEDEYLNFYYLELLLKDTGVNIIHVENGKLALETCIENKTIDLVLMDIQMPEMDGYEATKQIKKLKKSLPIIAITARAMNDDKRKALDAGCDDYVAKPVDMNTLISKIQEYFEF